MKSILELNINTEPEWLFIQMIQGALSNSCEWWFYLLTKHSARICIGHLLELTFWTFPSSVVLGFIVHISVFKLMCISRGFLFRNVIWQRLFMCKRNFTLTIPYPSSFISTTCCLTMTLRVLEGIWCGGVTRVMNPLVQMCSSI